MRRIGTLAALTLLSGTILLAQNERAGRWLDVEFPHDSPVLPVSVSLGPTTAHVKGSSIAIDVHANLLLRNTGTKDISGITLRVEAPDLTPSGKGSITLPSLTISPGEVFPVHVDMQLLRSFNFSNQDSAMLGVTLDCALFSDLTAYGPDTLGSRRSLMVYELEARRDRKYLAELLKGGRFSELREALEFGLPDLVPRQFGLEVLRDPRNATSGERAVAVHAMSFPGAPVQTVRGQARVEGNEVRSPEVQIQNRSSRMVRNIDMGWIVRDDRGERFMAGCLPAAVDLRPVQTGFVTEKRALLFSRAKGQPMSIDSLVAFVNDVEFDDGKLWIPSRQDIDASTSDPVLRREMSASPEQQRLADVYRKKGITGLAAELRKVH